MIRSHCSRAVESQESPVLLSPGEKCLENRTAWTQGPQITSWLRFSFCFLFFNNLNYLSLLAGTLTCLRPAGLLLVLLGSRLRRIHVWLLRTAYLPDESMITLGIWSIPDESIPSDMSLKVGCARIRLQGERSSKWLKPVMCRTQDQQITRGNGLLMGGNGHLGKWVDGESVGHEITGLCDMCFSYWARLSHSCVFTGRNV